MDPEEADRARRALEGTLESIDRGEIDATRGQRTFIAGAVSALEDPDRADDSEPGS